MERGQVLVLVAGAAIGIIAIIGLSIDVGLMFIGNARLRRAVDLGSPLGGPAVSRKRFQHTRSTGHHPYEFRQ